MAEEIKRPKVGLGVILMNYDTRKVLLGKRKGSHGELTWSFPGGHLEWMETLQDCAEREMLEETGLHKKRPEYEFIQNYEFIDRNSWKVTNDFFVKEQKHYITLHIRAKYLTGEPQVMEPEKCEEWRWYKWEKLLQEDLFTPIKNLIREGYNPFE